jgi:hypothetical protein
MNLHNKIQIMIILKSKINILNQNFWFWIIISGWCFHHQDKVQWNNSILLVNIWYPVRECYGWSISLQNLLIYSIFSFYIISSLNDPIADFCECKFLMIFKLKYDLE